MKGRADFFVFGILIGLVIGFFAGVVGQYFRGIRPDEVCDNECHANQHDRGEYSPEKGYCFCYDRDERP